MSFRRVYTDVSTFRAPFDHVEFAGLGDSMRMIHPAPTPPLPGNWPVQWPKGRSYIDVAQHRMPYRSGYYQDNTLFGLGDDMQASVAAAITASQQAELKRGRQQGVLIGAGITFVVLAVLAGGVGAVLSGPRKYG